MSQPPSNVGVNIDPLVMDHSDPLPVIPPHSAVTFPEIEWLHTIMRNIVSFDGWDTGSVQHDHMFPPLVQSSGTTDDDRATPNNAHGQPSPTATPSSHDNLALSAELYAPASSIPISVIDSINCEQNPSIF